jgi:hypothetical protein
VGGVIEDIGAGRVDGDSSGICSCIWLMACLCQNSVGFQ